MSGLSTLLVRIKMPHMIKGLRFFCWTILLGVAMLCAAAKSTTLAGEIGPSGYPIPRFVSIAKTEANMRVGPGKQFPVKWHYRRPGLPLEVIGEFQGWRQVRDVDGETGYMRAYLLDGRRHVIVKAAEGSAALRRTAEPDAFILAFIQNGVIASVKQCDAAFCQVNVADLSGWLARQTIWGVYPHERFDD